MFCFSLIFSEIQIWGTKKGMSANTTEFFKKINKSDEIHTHTWRGQDPLQFRFKDSKPSQASQAKVEQGLCHLYGWFIGKAAYLGLSPLSSLPLRTFQASPLYLNSLAVSVSTSIMAALRSILQVICKNKTKRMNKEENNHNITFNMDR